MFHKLKKQVSNNFNNLSKGNLFYAPVDREEIWQRYLSGFSDDTRQSNNCNACKSFLRQFGGIVAIKNGEIVSIFDGVDGGPEYQQSVENLVNYIHSLPIADIFLNPFKKCGTDKNLDSRRGILWQHFYIELPSKFVSKNVDSEKGQARDNKNVLKRSLDELTIDATETVLELIAQNSLYRGKEFENLLKAFLKLQKEYVSIENKEIYCWEKSVDVNSAALCRIRNTSIGTLLIDLSAGVELDEAVRKFERVVAPANYKRTTALVTPRMVEQAKQKLSDLGLLDSLQRRFATEADLNVEDVLFTYRSTASFGDIFEEVKADTPVNPKTFSKTEEIKIEDFISNVLPTAKSVEVLFESRHNPNLFSLVTAADKNSKSLFKWDNPFSWSYNGAVADSIKERVKAAGGKVDGVLRFSIQWNDDGENNIDFDAHAIEPNGNRIYFGSAKKPLYSKCRGQLDVDIINPDGHVAVENITWPDKRNMPYGTYKFIVNNYSGGMSRGGFSAEIEAEGELYSFECGRNLKGREFVDVAEVEYSPNGFFVKPLLTGKTAVNSVEKWGIKTNQFHKVSKIMLSPNFWGGKEVGNKHYFFLMDGCVAEDTPRPFFNEFLKEDLLEHRKVFETISAKLKIEDSKSQLNGLGFSSTKRDSCVVRVNSNFVRLLKIIF